MLSNARAKFPKPADNPSSIDNDWSAVFWSLFKESEDGACVETKTLKRLELAKHDTIVLLYTATFESRLCALSLAEHLRHEYEFEVDLREISQLSSNEKTFRRGLASFAALLVRLIESQRRAGRTVLLAPGGGFKAQFACSTVVGLLLDIPVFYIHEQFSELIEIPRLPIAWSSELVETAEEFFVWIGEDLRSFEEARARSDRYGPETAERIWNLVDVEDGCAFLSATGEAVCAAFRRAAEPDGTPIFFSSVAEKQWDESRSDGRKKEATDRLLGRIRSADFRNKAKSKINSDCRFYPGGGRYSEHVAFFEEDGAVVVAEFFYNHVDRDRKLDAREVMKALYRRGRPA